MGNSIIQKAKFAVPCNTYGCRGRASYSIGREKSPPQTHNFYCDECMVSILTSAPSELLNKAFVQPNPAFGIGNIETLEPIPPVITDEVLAIIANSPEMVDKLLALMPGGEDEDGQDAVTPSEDDGQSEEVPGEDTPQEEIPPKEEPAEEPAKKVVKKGGK